MSEEFVGWLDDEWNTILDQSQPIVRCRDCKFLEQYHVTLKDHTWEHCWCKRDDDHLAHAEPDGFCAWGVRRNDERA